MALSVVTFNIGSRKSEKEMAANRKKMINNFLGKHQPSLLYFQENTWRKDNIKNHVSMIKENYEAVSHKHRDAAVLYRKDVLRDEGSKELKKSREKEKEGSEELTELFRDAFSDKGHLDFVKFRERASFSKLTEIKTETTFIAISWHGEYIGLKDPQKKDKFKDLLLVMTQIHSQTHLPVILGGDFNIALDIVSDIIEEQGLKVYDYEPVNRETVIDFFVVTPDVELSGVSAFEDAVASENESEDSEELELKEVFDHDPVQGVVKFDIAKGKVASGNNEMDSLAHDFNKSVKLDN